MDNKDIYQEALNRAKIQLMSTPDSAFIIHVCFSMKHLWDDSIPTACTNGKYIKFNRAFFLGLPPQERVFLLMHESWHVCFLHMERLQTRDRVKWNIAGDHMINLMLIARGFKMPSMGLADPQYTGLSTEEIYNLLPTPDPSKVNMSLMDLELPEGDLEVAQQEIQEIIVQAAIQSKMAGDAPDNLPGEIQIFLDRLLNPKLPWQRILQKWLKAKDRNDYSMKLPNRRFFPQYHLPSLYSTKLMDLVVAVDTSGSVSDEEFTHFVSEISNIFRMMKPKKITLIQFDTEISLVKEVKSLRELSKVTFSGRGGTYIPPVLKWAEENKPEVLIIFTDGEFSFYQDTHQTPVLWMIHNSPDFTAPFGKVIHYEI